MQNPADVVNVRDGCTFEIECRAGKVGELRVRSESVCVKLGQRVRRDGREEIWHSVEVFAKEEDDGSLVIRVLVFNPDWKEPLQIASIRSRPGDGDCQTTLGCNLDHVTP